MAQELARPESIPITSPDYTQIIALVGGTLGRIGAASNYNTGLPWENLTVSPTADILTHTGSALQGVATGAAIGGPIGAAVGGVVGLVLGAFGDKSKREAEKAKIRYNQDAKAKGIIAQASRERKQLRGITSNFKKALNSGIMGAASAKISHSTGARYGYLSQNADNVTNKTIERDIRQDHSRAEAVLDGQLVATMQKIATLDYTQKAILKQESQIWGNRRTGRFDTSMFKALESLIEGA